VEDGPPQEPKGGGFLLGLFHGIPRTEKSVFFASPPDGIFLYHQRNLEAACSSEAEVRRQVRGEAAAQCGALLVELDTPRSPLLPNEHTKAAPRDETSKTTARAT
jgi:hypothetical protein